MNGTCVCHPGYGDSFVHRELSAPDGGLFGIRIPTDWDGTPIPGCGYDEEKMRTAKRSADQNLQILSREDLLCQSVSPYGLLIVAMCFSLLLEHQRFTDAAYHCPFAGLVGKRKF